MIPMMMAISKNHVDASSKYHDPSGTSVRNADQPLDTCSSAVTVPDTSPSNARSLPSASAHTAETSSPDTCSVTSSVTAPASNTLTPKSFHGMNPTIMTTNVRANTESAAF